MFIIQKQFPNPGEMFELTKTWKDNGLYSSPNFSSNL